MRVGVDGGRSVGLLDDGAGEAGLRVGLWVLRTRDGRTLDDPGGWGRAGIPAAVPPGARCGPWRRVLVPLAATGRSLAEAGPEHGWEPHGIEPGP